MSTSNDIKIHDDIDAHVEQLVAENKVLKSHLGREKQLTQRAINRNSRDIALHVREQKIIYQKDMGKTKEMRRAWLEWCRDVADIKVTMADDYILAADLMSRSKFLTGIDLGIAALTTVSSKSLNKKEMTAFQQFAITEDKPLSKHKIHVWAHEECGREIPEADKKKRMETVFIDGPVEAQSMTGRLKLGYTGRTLLGLGLSTPVDVVDIVCKTWAQRYHPDKGASTEDSQRVLAAIEIARGKK